MIFSRLPTSRQEFFRCGVSLTQAMRTMYFPADISTQVFQHVWSQVIDTSLGLYAFQRRAALLPFENEFVSRSRRAYLCGSKYYRTEATPGSKLALITRVPGTTCPDARTAQTGARASGSDLLVSPDPFAEAADQLAD